MLIGQLGWEKTDLIKGLKHLAVLLTMTLHVEMTFYISHHYLQFRFLVSISGLVGQVFGKPLQFSL